MTTHRRLPGGHIAVIGRGAKRVWLDVDRYPNFDADQSRWLAAVEMHARLRVRGTLAKGPRCWTVCSGWWRPTWGSIFNAPRQDEADVLAALAGIEDRDYLPARRYLTSPPLGSRLKGEQDYRYPTSLDDDAIPYAPARPAA